MSNKVKFENVFYIIEQFNLSVKNFFENNEIKKFQENICKINEMCAQSINLLKTESFEKVFSVLDSLSKMTIHEETIDSYEMLINVLEHEELTFYRGEDSTEYELIPSIYRNKNEEVAIHNYDYLVKKYEKISNLINKRVNYKFLSLMQHYGLSSPFIDFTKNPKIALYFAIYDKKTGIIKTIEKDVAFYKVKLLNINQHITKLSEANRLINQYNVEFFTEDTMDIPLEKYKGAPESYFIEIPTNDRMQIQEGLFLYLNNFMLSEKGFICNKLNDDALITKYIIPKEIINENISNIRKILNEYIYIYDVEKYLKYTNKKRSVKASSKN